MTYQEIIDYWYSEPIRSHWFASTVELDTSMRSQYESVWEQAAAGKFDHWKQEALGCLALILVFDQFPLNIFRGQAKSFQTEADAIEVARMAIANNFVPELEKQYLAFLFMPFMHSEKIQDQDLAVMLFEENQLKENIAFAKHHRNIIRQFGRFPHRNQILGRQSTAEEIAYLQSKEAFHG